MPCYRFGPFELDPAARVLRREGEPVPLAGKTLDTLVVLVENRGRLVDKEELLSRVWAESVVEEANLTQTIFTVRKILGDSPKDHRYIATVAGRGYQFVAPVTEPAAIEQTAVAELDEPRPPSRRNRMFGLGMSGIAMAGLAAVLTFWMVRRPGDLPARSPEVQRFTSYPGVETMPAFSPDGKEIAYVRAEHGASYVHFWRWQVGQANIYTKLVGAATEIRLTNHPGTDYYPAWAPDGQYIAFYRDEPGASGFYIVSAFGGHERRITNKASEPSGIAWLPDGRHLVASHFFEGSRGSRPLPLIEISLETGEERPITFPAARDVGDLWPAISPDGKTLAFLRVKNFRAVDVCFAPLVSGPGPRCQPLQVNWPQGLAWTASGDGLIVSALSTGPSQRGFVA